MTSTGIYCRPVCRVKLPRRENCRFFRHAAQAEAAGFRPCLRCRPELAPRAASWSTEDASRILALQAARLIDEPDAWGDDGPGAARIAARLGVSDRHLRRIFETQFGVSPLQYLQTRRLLAAKQLIADTRLPMTQVALASGFASVRRFNAAFVDALRPQPERAAPRGRRGRRREGEAVDVRLGYRPPYDGAAMLGFFARRAFGGVESLTGDRRHAAVRAHAARRRKAGAAHAGWLQLRFDAAARAGAAARRAIRCAAVLPIVISRVRAMLDLDADPMAINGALHASFPHGDGLRVPGTVDGFELAVRAVLGQQITVAAARTLGTRLVEAFGEPIATPIAGLDRLFPTPAALAARQRRCAGPAGHRAAAAGRALAIAREVARRRAWRCTPAPTCPPRSPRCRRCPASATGRRSTSRCARCAGPTPFRPATSRCRRRWACTTARARGRGLAGLAPMAQLRGAARLAQPCAVRHPRPPSRDASPTFQRHSLTP